MKKNHYITIINFIIIVAFLFCLTGCKKKMIAPPKNIQVDSSYLLKWDEVDNARMYNIFIYSVDNDTSTKEVVRTHEYSLAGLPEGDYEITIQSVSGDKKLKDSIESTKIFFHKYKENGCVYELTNGNLEYKVVRAGTIDKNLEIEGVYRNKPVTSIDELAFRGNKTLVSVTIGENITSLGKNAFLNCPNLEKVILPSTLQTIGVSCFQLDASLKEIIIPDKVTEIPDNAFAYCSSLERVVFGKNIQKIGKSSFQDCNALTELVIPDTITSIAEHCFAGCKNLKMVHIGANLQIIPRSAFLGCSALENVIFSDAGNLKEIDRYAFNDCRSLKEITIPSGVERINDEAFSYCLALEKVTISETVKEIGVGVFQNTKFVNDAIAKQESFIYADHWLVSFINYNPENPVTTLSAGQFKDTMVGIADYTFYENIELKEVYLPSTLKYIGYASFAYCTSLWKVRLADDSVVSIGDYAFAYCQITNLILNSGLKEIGDYAFSDNSQLNNNTLAPYDLIPETVTRVGAYAFHKTALWTTPRDNSGVVYAGNWVVGVKNPVEGTIALNFDSNKNRPAGIADYTFSECENLTRVIGLNECRYIGVGAFYKCTSLESVSLNRNLTEIRDYTFFECENIIEVDFPRTLAKIGDYAFYKCTSLSNLDLSTTKCESIGRSAFYLNTNLQKLSFGDSLQTIADYAFYKCNALTKVAFAENIRSIGQKSFYRCELLEQVTFNQNLKVIPEYAFAYCGKLSQIDIPDGVEKIERSAFYKCASVNAIHLGNTLKSVGDYAFFGLENVTNLQLGQSVESLGKYAFKGMKNLLYVVISDNVKNIGQHCFYGCQNLTIYTTASSMVNGWNVRFNSSYRPVFWGVELDEQANVVSIHISKSLFTNRNAKNGIQNPTIDGKSFAYWQSEDNKTYTNEEILNINEDCKLTAVYSSEE